MSFRNGLVSMLVNQKKYQAIQEYLQIEFPKEDSVMVLEYAGERPRLFKNTNDDIVLMLPDEMDTYMENAVTRAIEDGTLFDDAKNVNNTTEYIRMTTLPYNGMMNKGYDEPKALKSAVGSVVGTMNANGRFGSEDSDLQNGYNAMHDMVHHANDSDDSTFKLIGDYIKLKDNGKLPIEYRRDIGKVKHDVKNVNDVDCEDCISSDDYKDLELTDECGSSVCYDEEDTLDMGDSGMDSVDTSDISSSDMDASSGDTTTECGEVEPTEECGDAEYDEYFYNDDEDADELYQEATSRSLRTVKSYQKDSKKNMDKSFMSRVKKYARAHLKKGDSDRNLLTLSISRPEDHNSDEAKLYKYIADIIADFPPNRNSYDDPKFIPAKNKLCSMLGLNPKNIGIICPDLRNDAASVTFQQFNEMNKLIPLTSVGSYKFIHFSPKNNLTSLKPASGSSHFYGSYAKPSVFFFAVKKNDQNALKALFNVVDQYNYGNYAYEYKPIGKVKFFIDKTDEHDIPGELLKIDGVIPVYLETERPISVQAVSNLNKNKLKMYDRSKREILGWRKARDYSKTNSYKMDISDKFDDIIREFHYDLLVIIYDDIQSSNKTSNDIKKINNKLNDILIRYKSKADKLMSDANIPQELRLQYQKKYNRRIKSELTSNLGDYKSFVKPIMSKNGTNNIFSSNNSYFFKESDYVEIDDNDTIQEGFFTKKPKKLKPIPRDIIPYITIEANNIKDANDQQMIAGYTCSKLELVDFYLNCIDTQDDRYIVPHTRQYLVQMQNDLNRLLTQILRVRPVNKMDRMWKVGVNLPG